MVCNCFVSAVFTFPDLPTSRGQQHTQSRTKFEQLRARWEAVQQGQGGGEEQSANMVGRRMSQQPATGDAPPLSASKFRRTLSHGLAFISNPLAQRKTTPGRHPAQNPSLPVAALVTSASSHHRDALVSPTRDPEALEERAVVSAAESSLVPHQDMPAMAGDVNATSAALPRLRTTSFLPRPVRSASEMSIDEKDRTCKVPPVTIVTDPKFRAMQSKIPTPSPPLCEHRISSPRQYLPSNTPQQDLRAAVGHAVVKHSAGSPSKLAVRSRTTPNLLKASYSPPPAHYMTSNRTGYKRPARNLGTPNSTLQENISVNDRISQRRSQISEKGSNRKSLAGTALPTNRKSSVQGSPLTYSTQPNQSTPLMAKRRLSSGFAQQVPVTVKRLLPRDQKPHLTGDGLMPQSRLMAPRNPSTPTPLPAETARPHLPRSNTEKDLQRKTLGTPNGLGGVWRSSRALAAANHEVRLPRSFTFHNFGSGREDLPPVPAIPEQYRTPSLSSFFQPTSSHNVYEMPSIASSCDPILEGNSEEADLVNPAGVAISEHAGRTTPVESSDSSDGLITAAASSPPDHTSQPARTTSSYSLKISLAGVRNTENERPWSIADQQYEYSADIEPYFQVRDYMPPLYWAGRFQSRLDHWRTDAMMAELDSEHVREGPLGTCKPSQDKLASCYIFAQLRDLCLTDQAADSLWEFESRYRKDNKLVGAEYPLQALRKHDNPSTPKRSFGRAVRKLTPRKSSFVNLLKGKGWGKGDEAKPQEILDSGIEVPPQSS